MKTTVPHISAKRKPSSAKKTLILTFDNHSWHWKAVKSGHHGNRNGPPFVPIRTLHRSEIMPPPTSLSQLSQALFPNTTSHFSSYRGFHPSHDKLSLFSPLLRLNHKREPCCCTIRRIQPFRQYSQKKSSLWTDRPLDSKQNWATSLSSWSSSSSWQIFSLQYRKRYIYHGPAAAAAAAGQRRIQPGKWAEPRPAQLLVQQVEEVGNFLLQNCQLLLVGSNSVVDVFVAHLLFISFHSHGVLLLQLLLLFTLLLDQNVDLRNSGDSVSVSVQRWRNY